MVEHGHIGSAAKQTSLCDLGFSLLVTVVSRTPVFDFLQLLHSHKEAV